MDNELKQKVDAIINGVPYYMSSNNYDSLQYQFNYTVNTNNTNAGPVGSTSPNVTITNGGTWSSNPYTTQSVFSTLGSISNSDLKVSGDVEIEGDIKWQGHSLKSIFNKIEQRLAILVPDTNKLEQFEALKKAYNHYKILEALCHETEESDEDK